MKKTAMAITFFLCAAILISFSAPAAQANPGEAPEQPGLTLEQAIEKAINHSKVAKKDRLEIDRTEIIKDDAADNLEVIPGDSIMANVQLEVDFYGSLQTDLTWRMSKKNYDARLDGIALDVCKQYWDIMKLQDKVQVKKTAVQKAALDVKKSRLAYSTGLVSNLSQGGEFVGLEQALAAQINAETSLETTQNDLDAAYTEFNQLLGFNTKERPVLVDRPQIIPLEIENLDALILRAIEESPTVWLAEQGVSMQKYVQNLYFYTGQYIQHDEKEVAKEQAALDVTNARDATKLLVRNFYYTLKTLEETNKSAAKGVSLAQEALRVSNVMLDVGMATEADVVTAQSTLAEAQHALTELATQHAYIKLLIQKPWAAMYSAS